MFDKILEHAAELPSGVLDPKAAEKLVAGRIWRFGQTEDVNFYVITSNVDALELGPVEVDRRSASSPREFAEKVAKL